LLPGRPTKRANSPLDESAVADLRRKWSATIGKPDSNGRTIWIADAHRDDGKRYVVHAEEKLTTFMELESATRAYSELV
jgi:hypothetical protein